MMRRGYSWNYAPSFALCAMVGIAALIVNLYAHPSGGLQLPKPVQHMEQSSAKVGSLAFPREIVDSDGLSVRIPNPPQRIVSQALSIDEFVYILVPPNSVVGTSRYAADKRFSNVYRSAEQFHPTIASDPERVVSLSPDLILVSASARADYTSLVRSTGVPTIRMQTRFTTLEQVAETIRLAGYLLGADEAAAREEARFRRDVSEAVAMRPAHASTPRVLGLSGQFGFGSNTLFNDIVVTIGAINVAAEAGVNGMAEIDSESIARWDPDWIVTGCIPGAETATRAQLLRDPGIALTKAARNGHILVLENHVFQTNSPFVTSLIREMSRAIYRSPQPEAGAL